MKVALITTTINVPKVLALYRKADPSVHFFVAIDKKTPEEAVNFCQCDVLNTHVIFIQDQQKYKSSELIGWNTNSRRNIALLEALKWGADLIISVDDDMIPYPTFFWDFVRLFTTSYSGLQIGSSGEWCDVGNFTVPGARQRGLPPDTAYGPKVNTACDVEIGAAQGIILGVPDTDASTAMTEHPIIYSASDILKNGFVVHPQAYSIFNSQITAFKRELAPAFAQFYNYQGRNTDIFASVLMRRLMRDRKLYTHFGLPMGFHARQPRPLFNDLKAEMFGLEHINAFAKELDRLVITGRDAIDDCRALIEPLPHKLAPGGLKEAMMAFYDDVENVL